MHLKEGRVVEVENPIVCLKLLFICDLVFLKVAPFLLRDIHIPNKSLDLCGRQILAIDSAHSSRYFCRGEFTSRHFLY